MMKIYQKILNQNKKNYLRLSLYSIFIGILGLSSPIFIMQVYDRVIFYSGTDTLLSLTVGVVFALGFDFVIRQARSGLLQSVSRQIDLNLNRLLFDHFKKAPFEKIEKTSAQQWNSYFSDIEFFRNIFGGPTIAVIFELPFLCVAMFLVFIIAEPIFFYFILAVFTFALCALISVVYLKSYQKKEQATQFSFRQTLNQLTANRSVIRAIGVEDIFIDRCFSGLTDLRKISIKRGKVGDLFLNLSAVATPSTTILITVVGAIAVIDQTLSIGALVAANMLVGRTIGPLQQLINLTGILSRLRYSAERLQEFEESGAEEVPVRSLDCAVTLDTIEIKNVVFRFEGSERNILNNINISLGGEGYTCVVGKNGSGKSTFLKILMGLYRPSSGDIFIGDTNIKHFSRAYLNKLFSYVPQDNVIFNGSIKDNLTIRSSNTNEQEMVEVCRNLGFHNDVQGIEEGYEFQVGDGGYLLSPGQRQKISIIRSLIGPSEFILMDEPTSNLDRKSEILLRDFILNKIDLKPVFIATHSPYILSGASRLIIIDNGRIVLEGSGSKVLPKIGLTPAKVD